MSADHIDLQDLRDRYRQLRAPESLEPAVLREFTNLPGRPRWPVAAAAAAVMVLAATLVWFAPESGKSAAKTPLSLASLSVPNPPAGLSRIPVASPRQPGLGPMLTDITTPLLAPATAHEFLQNELEI